ncbi:MAG: hypothetical protein GW760_05545 [Legionella sp.]|nr:hypothetical protein [Legionella sp.]
MMMQMQEIEQEVAAPQQTQQLQRLPDVGVENVEMYRVHGVTLSTGNLWQYMILQSLFPQQAGNFRTPLTQEYINSQRRNFQYFQGWPAITRHERELDSIGRDVNYQTQIRGFLNDLGFDPASSGCCSWLLLDDDLPTKIAKAIAQIYYKNLELTVADIQQAIKAQYGQPWNEGEFSLNDIDDGFVSRIVHASIDNGRMELRTLLPYEQIVQVAVDELKHPPLTIQSVLEWMAAVWSKFVELLTDGWEYVFSPANP